MEEALRERVVGQDHVVEAISDAVRISRAGLQAPNRPVASFLFLGPTGVGKVSFSRFRIFFFFFVDSFTFVLRRSFAKPLPLSCTTTNIEDCKSNSQQPDHFILLIRSFI